MGFTLWTTMIPNHPVWRRSRFSWRSQRLPCSIWPSNARWICCAAQGSYGERARSPSSPAEYNPMKMPASRPNHISPAELQMLQRVLTAPGIAETSRKPAGSEKTWPQRLSAYLKTACAKSINSLPGCCSESFFRLMEPALTVGIVPLSQRGAQE